MTVTGTISDVALSERVGLTKFSCGIEATSSPTGLAIWAQNLALRARNMTESLQLARKGQNVLLAAMTWLKRDSRVRL